MVDRIENSWRYYLLRSPDSPLPRLARDPDRDCASVPLLLVGFRWLPLAPWYRILRDFVAECSDVVLVMVFQSL
jgi:hypothetical protein